MFVWAHITKCRKMPDCDIVVLYLVSYHSFGKLVPEIGLWFDEMHENLDNRWMITSRSRLLLDINNHSLFGVADYHVHVFIPLNQFLIFFPEMTNWVIPTGCKRKSQPYASLLHTWCGWSGTFDLVVKLMVCYSLRWIVWFRHSPIDLKDQKRINAL